MSYEKLIELIKIYDSFLIIIHAKPDGDSIAAALALHLAFNKMKKHSEVICSDEIPQNFLFLPKSNKIKHDAVFGSFDLIFLIDCGDLERTGFKSRVISFAQKNRLINIDHHPKNDLHKIAYINFTNYGVCATVEIIFNIINSLKILVDRNIATCLLTGLFTDTGGFRHNNTTSNTFLLASLLIKKGASLSKIAKYFSANPDLNSLKLRGIAFGRVKINPKYQLACTCIKFDDLKNLKADESNTQGIINFLIEMPNIKWAIVFTEKKPNLIQAKIRNKTKKFSVAKFATIFGGKGRKNMSGFELTGKLIVLKNDWKIELDEK